MNAFGIQYLEWDSKFFGFNIGKLYFKEEGNNLDLELMAKDYKLIYIIVNPFDTILNSKISDIGGILVDQKVLFETNINDFTHEKCDFIKEYKDGITSKKLVDLSIQAGMFSRYNTDKGFSNDQFNKFYETWIINSVNKIIADKVFVYTDEEITGLITIKHYKNESNIGLISVDKGQRGKNIGSKLLSRAKHECLKIGNTVLNVYTQKQNKIACRFYLKNAFTEKKIENIYHLWL